MTGPVDLPTETDAIRIVANGVPDTIKQLDCALGIVLSPAGGLSCKFSYYRTLEIQKLRRSEKLGGGLWKTFWEKDNECDSLFIVRRLL